MKKPTMNSEEKGILASYERGEWTPVKNGKAEIARLRQHARTTLQKNKRINIRLSESDLLGLQTKAVEEGLPYQTLIASVLHKYVRGTLAEKRSA